MEANPYEPPRAELTGVARERGGMYSPAQVAGAAFWGAPFAACWLLAENYVVLGNHRARTTALTFGVLSTVAVVALGFLLSEKFPRFILPAGYTLVFYQVASGFQGAQFNAHMAAGHEKQSNWRVVGVSVISLLVLMVALLALALALPAGVFPE
ncbi:MAG: hypothetical protein ACREJT_07810 [Myxococcota bacterium]